MPIIDIDVLDHVIYICSERSLKCLQMNGTVKPSAFRSELKSWKCVIGCPGETKNKNYKVISP